MKDAHCVCGGEWLPETGWRKTAHCEFDFSFDHEDDTSDQSNQLD